MTVCHLDGVESLGERANLVHLDKDRVGSTHLDALLQEVDVGDEEVVAHELAAVANALGELHPAFPVVLVEAVLDRVDRILVDELLQVVDLLVVAQLLAVRILLLAVLELLVVVEVLAILDYCKLACCAVHSNLHVLARLVASLLDGLDDAVESVLDAIQGGSKATLIAHCSAQAACLEQLGEVVEHLGTHADGLLLGLGTHGANHELLECDWGIAVSTTVDDVHHGNGENISVSAANVAIQWHVQSNGSCVSSGERNAEHCVGAELALGLGAVELEHASIDGALIKHAHALNVRSDDGVNIVYGLGDALAQIAALVAVAKFEGLVLTC